MSSERERQLEAALKQFLKPIKGIPFEIVIESLCGKKVEKFTLEISENGKILADLQAAMRNTCQIVQARPIMRARPNEVGNDMEPYVISALKAQGFIAAAPQTVAGKGKSTGYPDVKITRPGSNCPIFLEVKSYAASNHQTTQRSFYLSPAEDPKVSQDGYHLLVGFEMERTGNFYAPVAFQIVDLYGLQCDMKAEFNSDNRRLYSGNRVLAVERVPRDK